MDKKQLRQQLQHLRAALTASQRHAARQRCIAQIGQHPLWQQAKHIGVYHATPQELNMSSLITSRQTQGKHLHLPVIHPTLKGHMTFYAWQPDDACTPNRFGIAEPNTDGKATHLTDMDLIVVPCLGLTRCGKRLGTGGGYYDRYLNGPTKPPIMGVAFDIQCCDALPQDPWDQTCDAVVLIDTTV